MRRAEIALALFLLAAALLCLWDSWNLGFGWGMSGPESGFFPFYLSLGIAICSVIVLVKTFAKIKKDGAGESLIPEGGLKPILWVLLPSAGMVLVTELVGLHLAALLFLAFYMRAVGKIGWVTVALVSVLVPASLFVIFDKLFLIPLPQGLWGAYLIPF